MKKYRFTFLLIGFALFSVSSTIYADEFSSAAYKVLDPVIQPAGFGTSTSFQLWGTISENAAGTSSSASYTAGGGFLRYPYAAITSASTTATDQAIAVHWTPTIGYGGWTISSYSVGQATVSGGPYTYTNVGNVTSSNRTGLTNGVPYYFVVVANDIFGNAVATSSEVTDTPIAATLSFSINANTAYFGTLNSSVTSYASSTNATGSTVEVETHRLDAKTNVVNGYSIMVQGQTLTSAQNAGNTISPLLSNTAPSVGQEQFGLRMNATGGIGSVTAPYAASGFAFAATATTTSQVASAITGDNATTTYSVRYMSNIAPLTEAGNYSASLVYVFTANF